MNDRAKGVQLTPENSPMTARLFEETVHAIAARYPIVKVRTIGSSVLGRPLLLLTIGVGEQAVFFNAAHHANEWITTPLVLKFVENYADAVEKNASLFDGSARLLYSKTTLYAVPMVNPDGVDLVTGDLTGAPLEKAAAIAEKFPDVPFPAGWKANIEGVDLNLQYPAGWENARDNKFQRGITSPAPRDYVGPQPLSAPESRALYDLTRQNDFALTLSYHTQGKVIYWKYLDSAPKNAWQLAQKLKDVSGYAVEDTPYSAGFAGYKDWFVSAFNRPGYTIEAGIGVSPLALSQFSEMNQDNGRLMAASLEAAAKWGENR
ncbi:M14 family metallocarboxypeptidase [Oscillospiraceae bacterium WX1]